MSTTFDDEFLRRLEKGLRDQQGSFQATRDDVNLLKQSYGIIQRDLGNLTNAMEKLLTKFEASRKTNWPLLALLGGMSPIMLAGGAFFVSSYSATSIAPLHVETVSNAASLKALDSQVKELSEKEGQIETRYREDAAILRTRLAEVESQFHSVSNLDNIRAAQQERLNAMLWEKSHPGERYPNGTFFPTTIFQGSGGSPATMDMGR